MRMRRGARGGKTTDRSAQKLAGSGPAGTSYVALIINLVIRRTNFTIHICRGILSPCVGSNIIYTDRNEEHSGLDFDM